VQQGQPDRIADLLEEAAARIEELEELLEDVVAVNQELEKDVLE
jgi:hypothetical protein